MVAESLVGVWGVGFGVWEKQHGRREAFEGARNYGTRSVSDGLESEPPVTITLARRSQPIQQHQYAPVWAPNAPGSAVFSNLKHYRSSTSALASAHTLNPES